MVLKEPEARPQLSVLPPQQIWDPNMHDPSPLTIPQQSHTRANSAPMPLRPPHPPHRRGQPKCDRCQLGKRKCDGLQPCGACQTMWNNCPRCVERGPPCGQP